MGWWLLCGGFGAVLGVGAYSVSAGWFVAGGVVAVGGMTVGVYFGFRCGGYCPPCLWRVCLCVTVGLGCCGSWRVSTGCGGLVVVLLGRSVGFSLMGCCCGGRRAVRVAFGDVCGVGVLGREGLKMCSEGGSVCWVVFWLVWSCLCGACAPCPPCFWLVGGGAPVGGGYCLWLRVCVWLW